MVKAACSGFKGCLEAKFHSIRLYLRNDFTHLLFHPLIFNFLKYIGNKQRACFLKNRFLEDLDALPCICSTTVYGCVAQSLL